MTTGRRYGGADAESAHLVTSAVEADQVLSAALAIAQPLAAKAGATLGTIKSRMFADVLAHLADTAGVTLRQ
jgi:enoyl-CoA hydratase/carnithine racemase